MESSPATEEWRQVVGWPYEVSDRGRVRRSAGGQGARVGHMRKLVSNRLGYLNVMLSRDGVVCTRKVHRLVAEAFSGPIPPGKEVNHINGVKNDNRWPENLEVVTSSENKQHAIRTGLWEPNRGEGHSRSKLNEMQVRVVLRLIASGVLSQREIGRIFRVGDTAISLIGSGARWSHVATCREKRKRKT